jgi:hypothetical protein
MEFPADVRRVLWDVDPDAIDPERHLDFVIERVMARGNWAAMRWLREQIPRERLVDVLQRRGHRLSPRDVAYWRLVCKLPTEPQAPGGGRPPWLP